MNGVVARGLVADEGDGTAHSTEHTYQYPNERISILDYFKIFVIDTSTIYKISNKGGKKGGHRGRGSSGQMGSSFSGFSVYKFSLFCFPFSKNKVKKN